MNVIRLVTECSKREIKVLWSWAVDMQTERDYRFQKHMIQGEKKLIKSKSQVFGTNK